MALPWQGWSASCSRIAAERTVEKHSAAIFTKLDLVASAAEHRRVLAVLAYLGVMTAGSYAQPDRQAATAAAVRSRSPDHPA
jgi:hypothetical protein